MATGARTSYTDTTPQKRAVTDLIYMIDWTKAPLLHILGFDEGNVRKFKIANWPSTKVEWLEDTMSPYTSTTGENWNDSDTTGLGVATGTGSYFRQGDIIQVGSEYMLVTSVATDDLSVSRAYGGTSAAASTSGATITLLTRAMPEGADFTTGHTTTKSAPYNYTQIISEAAKVTRTQQRMSQYAIKDEMAFQVSKLFNDGGNAGKLPQLLQRTFYYGKRVQRSVSAYGSMGGFETFVTTNVANLANAAIQRADIHTKIRQIRDAGGNCDLLVTSSWGIEKINAMYEGLIRTTQDEKRGGSALTMLKTPHGEVELVYDWMCPPGRMYFVNSAKCGWVPFDAFKANEIERQGDFYVRDVVGEYSFVVANEESHGYIYGINESK